MSPLRLRPLPAKPAPQPQERGSERSLRRGARSHSPTQAQALLVSGHRRLLLGAGLAVRGCGEVEGDAVTESSRQRGWPQGGRSRLPPAGRALGVQAASALTGASGREVGTPSGWASARPVCVGRVQFQARVGK